ncbi:PAS domain-containing sensor histidine kinase [Aestuariispira insulae]|uniref:histidine kinase n=1 Tax=Aestuariispira insulae TaxID=1461337 RepID=A0A3D9HVP5_9PROT|nr:ATP-binding protein [Aestuariispira insulae]RED53583.1 PAS domain S-box-containing protein [Aestuariispira insulae]
MTKGRFQTQTLTGKFLLLALPPMIFSAAIYLVALSWFQARTIHETERQITVAMAQRYADILSRPIWNLEEETTSEILDSLVNEPETLCIQLAEVIGLEGPAERGECGNESELQTISASASIVFTQGRVRENIGSLYLVREFKGQPVNILKLIAPQIILTVIVIGVLIIFAFYGFRRSVTAPLDEIQHSLLAYEETGKREAVKWSSTDELGRFVEAYNASLARQEASEMALRKQLTLTRTLLNTVPNPVAFLNPDFTLRGCNESFTALFGIQDEHDIGLPISDLMQTNPWASLPEDIDQAFSSNTERTPVYSLETMVKDRLGKERFVIFSTSALRGQDGRINSLVSVMQDITERKDSEVELQRAKESAESALAELKVAQDNLIQSEKMASLGSLVAGISHEINTPVGSSITVASSISEKTSDFKTLLETGKVRKSDLTQYLNMMAEASEILNNSLTTAAELVHSFKQVAVDQTTSKRRRFNLRQVLSEVTATLQPAIKKTPHSLELDLDENIAMDSYPGPLGQVLTNIVNNALLHAFESKDRGNILVQSRMEGDKHVMIEIRDDGCGIPTNHIKRIFDPFFTTKMGTGGTGLGLNVTYNIVTNLLGGSISVTSHENEGSQFQIKIPITAPVRSDEEEAQYNI